ncbi:MAG TPA: hypothetical protein DEG65_01060, partial [Methylophaga sp.]|nr:hypothetical protein [Methylophaga sp.]
FAHTGTSGVSRVDHSGTNPELNFNLIKYLQIVFVLFQIMVPGLHASSVYICINTKLDEVKQW